MRWTLFCLLATIPPVCGEVSFNRDIRPIMADTCFRCHGPDKNARMMGLRLDLREEALKTTQSGVTPIVPGDPDHSAIIQRIFATDRKIMPPASAHKELTASQKATIRQWIAEGAKYEGHWAYQPVQHYPVSAAENPIDYFIRARLDKEGLKPSPEADRRTLIRRVTLDLTGLPPTPDDVDAFVKDGNYEQLVNRLMASPRYAEMQAMHWLDAVRYADTCGFHGDNVFPAWPYRDYVLRAIRDNMPFDRFTREQLAGDLLPNASVDQKVASAYNRMNRTSAEGGLQPKEYLAKYAADRARTTAVAWLGSTVGCAECHDHKFDPFTSRDFYSMEAFFADIKETGLVPDRGTKAWGSLLELPTDAQRAKQQDLKARLEAAKKALDDKVATMTAREQQWEKDVLAAYKAGKLNWKDQRPFEAKAQDGAKLTIYNDEPLDFTYYDGGTQLFEHKPGGGLVVASGPNPANETYTVSLKPGEGTWTALGVHIVQEDSLPGERLGRGADRVVITEVDAELNGRKLKFVLANQSNSSDLSRDVPAMAAIDGDPKTGWGISGPGDNNDIMLALRFAEKVHTQKDTVMTVRLHQDSDVRRATAGRFRIALSDAEYSWPSFLKRPYKEENSKNDGLPEPIVKALEEKDRKDEQKKAILNHFAWMQPDLQPLVIEVAKLDAELAILEGSIPKVVVSEATEPREIRILARGNFLDESGAVVQPAIPAFLGKLDTGSRRATRLDLANWLVSDQNPLTPRVTVNRIWRQFFGTGIFKTLDDLGSQGEWPRHPELLDWLASEFVHPQYEAAGTHDWDMKHIVRTIVMSQAYRQSSAPRADLEEKDPDNRLIARQSRYRVDAEEVRDIELSVAGLLVEKFGGPSVKPYQPDGYLATLNFPKREYAASHGDDLYRRGIYTLWQRTFLQPSLLNFDAPAREECVVNRVNSNTPLQALDLLNDPIYVEAARVFAENMLKLQSTPQAEINAAFERALSRKPSPEESRVLMGLYQESLAEYRTNGKAASEFIHTGEKPVDPALKPADLAAMTTVARAILNLHETITRN
ncbi:MAG TPA: PSD1 and planctomycete cytochrome C domain-containing protein [Bryobacteraceae bacterium]|nr:PSD1 and planctomycete cytochrome C domain-containing protein [Bryobacteraceae bacterium]